MPHSLPSGNSLASFTAHYKMARFNAAGTCDLTFSIGRDMAEEIVKLSTSNDGLALNVEVWETKLEGDIEGLGDLAELAKALGIET